MKKQFFSILFILALPFIFHAQKFDGWIDDASYIVSEMADGGKSQLYAVDAVSGKKTKYKPDVEKNITDFVQIGFRSPGHVSADETSAVLTKKGDIWYYNMENIEGVQLTETESVENNPRLSPDGSKIDFTRDRNLYTYDIASKKETQLTFDGSKLIYNGWASWVYFEEILGRGSRYRAFYWSPDSEHIAFLHFDDTPVEEFPIYWSDGDYGRLEETRYPKSGYTNPDAKLGIVNINNTKINWIEEDSEADQYTAWCLWSPKGDKLVFQELNRDQNKLRMYSANIKTGEKKLMYTETQPTWVEFYTNINWLKDDKGFIVLSDRDGWSNIYWHNTDGSVKKQITDFDWRVTSISKIDEEKGRIFFTGTGEKNTDSHLFMVNMDGSGFKKLTKDEGSHRTTLSPGGSYFVTTFSNYYTPNTQDLYRTSKGKVRTLSEAQENMNEKNGVKVEHFTIRTDDGFDLPAMWVLPPDFDENDRYPVIFSVYGGPDAGTVRNTYRDYSNDKLSKSGVIHFTVDHRASGKFGKKGLDYMHRNLGKWEMNDYIVSAKWLKEKAFVDPTRIGIRGGSYGGYVTALALTYAGDHFTHGVSSAPVTDWKLYDNVYTERYMDTPQDNPEGYKFGSVMTHADKLKGKLLLVHGTTDDNVHMQNTMQLIDILQDLNKDFEMMFYPGERHGVRGAKRIHSSRLAENFWTETFDLHEIRP
jgi:dipeptidyl-peptidase-4